MSVQVDRAEHRDSRCRRARAEGTRRMLVSLVGSALSVDRDRLCAAGRGTAEEAYARQIAVYIAHTTLGLSYTEAGRLFGRDRTTVAHACRIIEERRESPRVDQFVDRLERAACGNTAERRA
ncbi:helix-turn-helix domain-containing protein [Kaistia terrae]|uniref:Helix-turn-helix domain-containing protein n=1 Tax=Kaistia terrae TaxID=537017 RepID=A0ABW0PUX6_9HYPH|nr:helix-turn-helix domain-containing protein [Kaistia terrae]MCX5576816.1 chromosomal replication initiator DnaA [Kaistia terrae]